MAHAGVMDSSRRKVDQSEHLSVHAAALSRSPRLRRPLFPPVPLGLTRSSSAIWTIPKTSQNAYLFRKAGLAFARRRDRGRCNGGTREVFCQACKGCPRNTGNIYPSRRLAITSLQQLSLSLYRFRPRRHPPRSRQRNIPRTFTVGGREIYFCAP